MVNHCFLNQRVSKVVTNKTLMPTHNLSGAQQQFIPNPFVQSITPDMNISNFQTKPGKSLPQFRFHDPLAAHTSDLFHQCSAII